MSIQISKSPTTHGHPDLQVEEVSTPKSVNFGPGMEMFMNERRSRPNSSASKSFKENEISLDDLNEFDKLDSKKSESGKHDFRKNQGSPMPMKITVDDDVASIGASSLNDIFDEDKSKQAESNQTNSTQSKGFMSLFGLGNNTQVNKEEYSSQPSREQGDAPSLGRSTANVQEDHGIPTFKDIPIHPDMDAQSVSKPKRSHEETLREKFKYLRKLEELENRGVKLTKHYSMESDLDEMIGEYEMVISEKEKQNSVKFQAKMLMAAVTGLEFLNNKVNPFDLQLDGWAESVNENITDYDEVFSELHEKYRGKAKMAPEIKLLFMLGGSAVMLHMTNTMFKSAMPGMDDIMRQNPELMQQFTKAAASSMGQQNPGFGDFMGNMMGQGSSQRPAPEQTMRPPRDTRDTREEYTQRNTQSRQYPKESAMPRYDEPPTNTQTQRVMESRKEQKTAPRPEMKGPSDLGDILSRLKPKGGLGDMPLRTQRPPQNDPPVQRTPRQPQQPQQSQQSQPQRINPFMDTRQSQQPQQPQQKEQRSTISIQELKELQTDMEKTSRRRGKSERNTISLDL